MINGSVISIKFTNIVYTNPHVFKVNENDCLLFDCYDNTFINIYEKIKFKEHIQIIIL